MCAVATMIADDKGVTSLSIFWGYVAALALPVVPLLDLVRWLDARRTRPRPWQWHTRLALRRAGLGLCVSCGYDLRASRGRRPECGASAAAAIFAPRTAGGGGVRRPRGLTLR